MRRSGIRAEIDEYLGAGDAQQAAAPLWMGLEGEGIQLGSLSSRILATWLDRFRNAVRSVADFIEESGKRGATRMRFEGALVPKHTPIRLVPEIRSRLKAVATGAAADEHGEFEGILREIDLDAQRVILRKRADGGPDLRCRIPDVLMHAARTALDHRVKLGGLLTRRPVRLEVQWIELEGGSRVHIHDLPDDV